LTKEEFGQEKRVDGRSTKAAFFLNPREHGRVMPGSNGSAVDIRSRVAFPDLIIWNRTNRTCSRQKRWVIKTTILRNGINYKTGGALNCEAVGLTKSHS
jgi:hypothetical protein